LSQFELIIHFKETRTMKNRILTSVALAAALLATTGCGKKRPPNLLPPAGASDGAGLGADGTQGGLGQGVAAPGSRADFIQNVPSDRVFFALDSFSLTAEARATLDAQAQWLNSNPQVSVTIEGHADERGTREYNIALGERRANSARVYLESRGVSSGRMRTVSFGKERPEAFGSDEASHSRNRRAVTVVPE
jgi:peptidoglycan-associated lipoprotein